MYHVITDEQHDKANQIDLANFLKNQGEVLLKSGREYRLASDHSVTVHGNKWYDHADQSGGYPIEFVMKYYKSTYVDAVKLLLGGEVMPYVEQPEPTKPFVLPPANRTMNKLYAYLLYHRKIDRAVVDFFVHQKLLYESKEGWYHNIVFVGVDENNHPTHAHKRSMNQKGNGYKCTVSSSNPCHSFHHVGTSDQLFVFEAPIDLLSYLTLHPTDWQSHYQVALCGVSDKAMLWMLNSYPQIKTVHLCLDNDLAGEQATKRLQQTLIDKEYTVIIEKPTHKDWNDDLMQS